MTLPKAAVSETGPEPHAGSAHTPEATLGADPHLRRLRAAADRVYDAVLPRTGAVALVDFPDYSNCGDSAIWLGQRAMLRGRGLRVRYGCAPQTYSERVLRCVMPGGTVLLQGGGNFGSLWPHHHRLRLELLEALRDYRIVQLPQSLHFEAGDRATFERTARAVAAHPDFTLLVRDRDSLAIGERLGARTLLCPDSAHYLELSRETAARVDCVVLARTDKESGRGQPAAVLPPGSVEQGDWLDEPTPWLYRFRVQMLRAAYRRPRAFQRLFQPVQLAYFDALARQRLLRGTAQLSRGRVLLTDRLHAHILGTLLGIPNVVLDNSYGKVHGYIRTWMAGHPLCHPAGDADEARALLDRLAAARTVRPAR
jgi:pyruvyl transferase EpsO